MARCAAALFCGVSAASMAFAILEKDPEPLSATQPTAPPAFDLVIRTCVAKDPDERFQTAHDLMLQLRWLAQPSLSSSAAAAQPAMPAKSPRTRAIWATVAILALVAAGLAGYLFAPSGQSSRVTRTLLEPPDKIVLDPMGDFGGPPVLSPQGDRIVFCAHGPDSPRALWIRSLESFSAQRLEGTDGAINPFWSPDGRFIGFFANQKLYRIPATGGVPSVLAEAPNARGGSWGRNDIILFAPDIQSSILQVSANGGKPVAATKVDVNKHTTHRWPVFLPDGKHFLYLATNHNGGRPEDNGVYFASLDGKDNRMLVPSDAGGDYASGYLLYHAGTALMAQPFDPASGKLAGEAVSVVERVRQDPGVWRTVFTVSQNGLLAYQPGSAEVAGSQLAWVDRSGKQVGMVGERGPYMDPRISPDGKRLAVSIGDPQREIWICDLERGTRTRLTFSQAGAARLQPGWSPDGKTIVYTGSVLSVGGGKALLYSKPASGTGGETLTQGNDSSGGGYFYGSWSPDGKLFVYLKRFGPSDNTVYARPASGGEEFKVVGPASPRANVIFYRISPNGRWIAYVSDESGRDEVYLAPFPRGEGKWQVTSGGGDFPSWRGDSKEIYFLSVNSISMLACSIAEKGNELEIGPQQALFTAHFAALGTFFDAAADGKRFILNLAGDDAPTPVHLVTNWPLELKKK
jgi:Tol biopolymer transport system component